MFLCTGRTKPKQLVRQQVPVTMLAMWFLVHCQHVNLHRPCTICPTMFCTCSASKKVVLCVGHVRSYSWVPLFKQLFSGSTCSTGNAEGAAPHLIALDGVWLEVLEVQHDTGVKVAVDDLQVDRGGVSHHCLIPRFHAHHDDVLAPGDGDEQGDSCRGDRHGPVGTKFVIFSGSFLLLLGTSVQGLGNLDSKWKKSHQKSNQLSICRQIPNLFTVCFPMSLKQGSELDWRASLDCGQSHLHTVYLQRLDPLIGKGWSQLTVLIACSGDKNRTPLFRTERQKSIKRYFFLPYCSNSRGEKSQRFNNKKNKNNSRHTQDLVVSTIRLSTESRWANCEERDSLQLAQQDIKKSLFVFKTNVRIFFAFVTTW